jgi:hypothetical protein
MIEDSMILSIATASVTAIGIVIGALNHRRCRSRCNDMKLEASLDIENTSVSVKGSPALPAPKETPS